MNIEHWQFKTDRRNRTMWIIPTTNFNSSCYRLVLRRISPREAACPPSEVVLKQCFANLIWGWRVNLLRCLGRNCKTSTQEVAMLKGVPRRRAYKNKMLSTKRVKNQSTTICRKLLFCAIPKPLAFVFCFLLSAFLLLAVCCLQLTSCLSAFF